MIGGVIIFVVLERKRRAMLKKNPSKEPRWEPNLLPPINLAKFWTLPRILTMLLGLAVLAFGPYYFWNVPDTPLADFVAGLGLLLLGTFLILIPLVIALSERQKAIIKSRDNKREEV